MKEKKKTGAPTKYKEHFNKQAKKLCLLGATDKEMAEFFEVAESTINKWKLDFPKFSESIKEGKIIADMKVAESLYNTTQDRMIPTQQAYKLKKVTYEGKKRIEEEVVEIVDMMTSVPANERSIQFWLRNRRQKEWRDPRVIQGDEDKPLVVKQITGMEIL